MRDIEAELSSALRRKDAPPGLAGRIIAAAEGKRRWTVAPWLACAAMVLLMVGFGWEYHAERQRRLQAEITARQLETALRIAADLLTKVERQVRAPATRVIHVQADKQEVRYQ